MSYKALAAIKEHVELELIKTLSPEEINKILNTQKKRIDDLELAAKHVLVFLTGNMDGEPLGDADPIELLRSVLDENR